MSKPKTININYYEVPEPVIEPLKHDQEYWVVDIADIYKEYKLTWDGNSIDKLYLNRGLIHLTKEAAELHTKALLSFTEVE